METLGLGKAGAMVTACSLIDELCVLSTTRTDLRMIYTIASHAPPTKTITTTTTFSNR